MFTILSLTVAIKDYLEIIHQLITVDAASNIKNYMDIGPVLVYFLLSIKQLFFNILSFHWVQNLWTLPVIVPDIASAMVSEISVLDGYFHTAFTFLDNPAVPATNLITVCFQKVFVGLANSLFLFLPTSVAHIITLRRFLIQGLEAGYISGLGVVSGNMLFLASVIFGWRFFLIPWLSLDIFRYLFGFILLVKYMWDSANERRMVLEDLSKVKIFLVTFLLALTEQTSIFPFISNLSFGAEATPLESFSSNNLTELILVHGSYLGGILIGSLSLLHLTCWFWENPAFQIYMWAITSFKVKTGSFYKYLNFGLLYLTMLAAISSIPYFGLDYTLTSPFGLVYEDRILEEKMLNELSFLNTGPTDRNTRRNRGRHPRRSRWNRRTRKYRSFQTHLYEKESYDWMTIEDLNFGFDRQWIHRKMRNHRARYRLFPGKLTRSLKDQARKGFTKRHAFFDTTENYFYHPSFHEYTKQKSLNQSGSTNANLSIYSVSNSVIPYIEQKQSDKSLVLNKFARKVSTKIATSQTALVSANLLKDSKTEFKDQSGPISSLRWKRIFSNIDNSLNTTKLRNFYQKMVLEKGDNALKLQQRLQLSKKDRLMLRYRTFLYSNDANVAVKNNMFWKSGTLLHPIKYYLQKEQAYNRKLQYYGVKNFRRFAPNYSPPLFRVIMQRYFYSYKPTKRWFRTLKGATMRRYLRKSTRKARTLQASALSNSIQKVNTDLTKVTSLSNEVSSQGVQTKPLIIKNGMSMDSPTANMIALASTNPQTNNLMRRANHFYSMKGKRASRYRYQIYRDVLQHWYYSPLNRILPKIDIDSFIKRQPTSHFLNSNEERILHLRRYLLSEHYDTLRWYTYMKNYKQMKEKIGGTKSLSSRTYNQQFFGTFKKIRHLFAVTPSLNDQPILTFDQSLYNEYENTAQRPIMDTSIVHEELLGDDYYTAPIADATAFASARPTYSYNGDIFGQSSMILKEYLTIANPIRQALITDYLKNKNYWGLTQFLYKGEKTRGKKAITNERDLIQQEKDYLGINQEMKLDASVNNLPQSTVISLLRKWKKSLGNQKLYKKALKNQFKNWRRHKKRWRKKLQKYRDRKFDLNSKLSRVSTITSGVRKAVQDANSVANVVEIEKTKLNIGTLRKNTNVHLEIQMNSILTKLHSLKTSNNTKTLEFNMTKFNRLRNKLTRQVKTTSAQLYQIYKKAKTKSWWNKKSTESWRPSRRRLDIDGLRKRIKRKSDSSLFNNEQYNAYYSKEKSNQANSLSNTNTQELISPNKTLNWQSFNGDNAQLIMEYNKNTLRQKQIENDNKETNRNINWMNASDWNNTLKANQFKSSNLYRQFKRKRVSRRRGRKLGPAGYSRRPNLSTLVKRQITFNQSNDITLPNMLRKGMNIDTTSTFELIPQKNRYFRKRKHRDWEKKIKPNNGIKTGKYRKRKLSFYGKVRSVQKQLIRVRWKLRLQKWWWQFLPALEGAADAKWQINADKNLISTLEKMTEKQILKRDTDTYKNVTERVLGENRLQIGDRDFKPLQAPEAIRIRNELEQQGKLNFGQQLNKDTSARLTQDLITSNKVNDSFVGKLTSETYNNAENNVVTLNSSYGLTGPKMQITNAVPFYAGWDESLRKLVITNVLFSLRDASIEMKNLQYFDTLKPLGSNDIEFTLAPIKAQNGATTVYWQTPFTTYETDQFFTLGVDGFSPLQWRRFNFKQSIVKSWTTLRNSEKILSPLLVKTLTKDKNNNINSTTTFDHMLTSEKPSFTKLQKSAIHRRRQKRYKRIRRHPRAPVWYPSGALISDVLPTQYVYAFDYTSRRPRDRYIQRRWRKRSQVDNDTLNGISLQSNNATDFTLRRRPNGRRKYHRRGGKLRALFTVAYPQRRKMVGLDNEADRWRPDRAKKETGYTTKLEEIRKRRGMSLRRRKLRQIFPKINRYRPFNGGFVWPGDYLMLEQSKVPKLRQINSELTKSQLGVESSKTRKAKSKKLRRKIKRKTRNIAQWNVQPKKYLLQKHNIKVLKKKLQKSYRTNQLQIKLQQLSTIL